MTASRLNALDQALDIAGSLTQASNLTLTEEPLGLGAALAGRSGTAASISAKVGDIVTVTGLTGFADTDIGTFLTLSGTNSVGNSGTFLIVAYVGATQIDILNPSGVSPDGYNGAIVWTQRGPYTLEDDLNYARTDRTAIKGVAYYNAIPTYTRPTANTTYVPANLANIATKTTDARGFILTRAFYDGYTTAGYTQTTISATGALKHAGSPATDQTGVPVFDAGPYTGDWKSCFVDINDGYAGTEMLVQTGIHIGERIFGITYAGASTSPNSVEVRFYSCPIGSDIATSSTAYTWEAGLPDKITIFYGFFDRLDLLPDDAFRTIVSLGLQSDGYVLQQIDNILLTLGTNHNNTFLTGLTNLTAYYPFYNLPDATPSVTEAFNTLNEQIGNRNYTGAILTDGYTITASLQQLANAITSAVIRTIERLSADINANTAHTLPGGLTYTQDGTNNGQNLWVFTRGVLRDPGNVASGNDYAETSTSQITFYAKQKSGDHINYFTK
jgi:hypothetical protein